MPEVYFLDRNVIALIKKYRKHTIENHENTFSEIEKINQLKKIDNKKNIISSLLSIIEGQDRGAKVQPKIEDDIADFCDTLDYFFKKAQKDTKFLEGQIKETSEILKNHTETKTETYLEFILWASENYLNEIKRPDRLNAIKEALMKAVELGISPNHPVVIFCIAQINRVNYAIKTLKFKKTYTKEDAYNAYSDIAIKIRLPTLIAHKNKFKQQGNMHFVSFDSGILAAEEFFQLGTSELKNQGSKITIKTDLKAIGITNELLPDFNAIRAIAINKFMVQNPQHRYFN